MLFSQRLAHSSVRDAPENAYQGLTLPSPLISLTSKCPLQRRQDSIGKNIVWREAPRDLFKIIPRVYCSTIFYACIIKRCAYVCVEEGRGAYKRFTRRPRSTRLTPRIRQQGRVAFVSSSESIRKRSPDRHSFVLSSRRTKERSCNRMTSKKKMAVNNPRRTSLAHILPPKRQD